MKLFDEDELNDAYNRLEINKETYDMAYNEANELIEKLRNNKNKLKEFTDKYFKKMECMDYE